MRRRTYGSIPFVAATCAMTLIAGLGTQAHAADDNIEFVTPDSHPHVCTRTNGTGGYSDNDTSRNGTDRTGDVDITNMRRDIEIGITGQPALVFNNDDAVTVPYAAATAAAPWAQQERIRGGLNAGFQYVRQVNQNTGALRYQLQITRPGTSTRLNRQVYWANLNAYQRDRVGDLRAAVNAMNLSANRMAGLGAGAVGTATIFLGVNAMQENGINSSGVMAACAALIAGVVAVGLEYNKFLSHVRDAVAAWDQMQPDLRTSIRSRAPALS